jgi:hypothetical protein
VTFKTWTDVGIRKKEFLAAMIEYDPHITPDSFDEFRDFVLATANLGLDSYWPKYIALAHKTWGEGASAAEVVSILITRSYADPVRRKGRQ